MNKSLVILFMLCSSLALCQNLIPNPSFEEYKYLPTDIAQGKKCIAKWTFPNYPGEGDYYHSRSTSKKSNTDQNYFGNQAPHSGSAYVGICLTSKFREYLQVRLIEKLAKNIKYKISLFISHGDKAYLSTTNEFNIIFSKNPFTILGNDHLIAPPKIKFSTTNKFNNRKEWKELTYEYTANGNEQYFTFGSFLYEEDSINHGEIEGIAKYAHYYIDDVSITKIKEERDSIYDMTFMKKKKSKEIYPPGKTFMFNNLQFKPGKSTLLPPSFPELDRLYNFLITHPKTKLKIVGHTDNTGTFVKNLKLSYDRAKAVKRYLTRDNCIEVDSISIEGKGDREPLGSNDTESGRKANRRVEFMIF